MFAKSIGTGFITLLVLCFSALMSRAQGVDELNKLVNQSNFIVDGGCSGTLISLKHRLVLTNHHCIDGRIALREREEVNPDGMARKVKREEREDVPITQRSYKDGRLVGSTSYLAVIVAHRQKSDLALLQIRAGDLPYTTEAKVLPEGEKALRGEQVFVVGNPAGLDGTVVNGNISSMNRMGKFSWTEGEVRYIQFAGGIWFGNSGGALYNVKGNLIGVPFFIAGTAHLGGAVHYDAIRSFLADNCYAEVYKDDAEDFKVCSARKEEEAKKRKERTAWESVSGSPEPRVKGVGQCLLPNATSGTPIRARCEQRE